MEEENKKTETLGERGEREAAEFLAAKSYTIVEKNWRIGRNEVDIIAKEGNILVFVEVKTRSSNYIVEPEFAVNRQKQQVIIRAASAFTKSYYNYGEIRFDIISIIVCNNVSHIKHIIDAYYPTL